jgi:two-component system, cell cycle sensor histidine kinase and response regulator CckA
MTLVLPGSRFPAPGSIVLFPMEPPTPARPQSPSAGSPSFTPSSDLGAELIPLLDAISDACMLLDAGGRVRFANARVAQVLGVEIDEVVDADAWELLTDEMREPLRRAHARVLESGVPALERVRTWSGRRLYARLAPLAGDVVVLFVNPAQRDHALVFDNIHDGVLVMDPDSRIVDWNPAAERIYGYSRAEALGRTPAFFHHPSVGDRLEKEIREALLDTGRWAGALPFRTKLGRDGVADVIVVEQRDEAGALLGFVGVNRDATERVRAESALRASEEQLRQAQKMEAVGRLAGGVAHDFNNILTVVTSYAELLRATLAEDDARRRDVDEVLKATSRAVTLTRQLLAFGRRQRVRPTLLDPSGVVSDMSTMLRQLVGERVELALTVPIGHGWVRCDQGQLEQVVMNLAVNARDAMPDGGVLAVEVAPETLTAEDIVRRTTSPTDGGEEAVSPEAPGDYVVVRVSDTGAGMSPEVRRRIFEPFFTTKGTGRGTGLGLATVYAIVTQSGGHLRVRSAPGEGTTIEAYLPRAVPQEGELEREGKTSSGDESVRGGTETILVVEDESAVRLSVRRILERAGYAVLEARHGGDALRLWRERKGEVALVLSDVMMPEMGGLELAAALRAEAAKVRILFMSGYTGAADPTDPASPLASVAGPLLQKPFESAQLLREVRRQLDSAEQNAKR